MEVGGPAGFSSRGVAGHVTFSALDHGRRGYSATASDGEFAVLLVPGRYRVTGYSPTIISDGRPLTCMAYPPVVTVRCHIK
jgi:hypothetical protein